MIGIDNFSTIPNLASTKQSLSIESKQSPRFDADASIVASIATSNLSPGSLIQSKPLDLVYQAAIDRINEEVAPYLGEGAIERVYEQGIDVSPDATANRIVTLSTALFPLYEQQNPEFTQEESLSRFIDVIRSGVEQGFFEAREILQGLGVLEGKIEADIDRTFNLVLEGFAGFVERYS